MPGRPPAKREKQYRVKVWGGPRLLSTYPFVAARNREDAIRIVQQEEKRDPSGGGSRLRYPVRFTATPIRKETE